MIGGVLLLAGKSTRFGGEKMLADFNGQTIGERAIQTVQGTKLSPVAAVVRHEILHDAAIAASMQALYNLDPSRGISSSIRIGLTGVLSIEANIRACMFIVGDQPFLSSDDIDNMCNAYLSNPTRIVALGHGEKRANPVIFPGEYFDELLSLTGDVGGSYIIKRNPDKLFIVQANDERALCDIDTQRELKHHHAESTFSKR